MKHILNESNSFKVHVTDEFMNIMFDAIVAYDKANSFQDMVKPFSIDTKLVEPMTGNAGKNFEYHQTFDGVYVDYKVFSKIMNSGY